MNYSQEQNYSSTMNNMFNNNMLFFKVNNSILYNKINELTNNIKSNTIKINYRITNKNNSPNIYDIKKKCFLYSKTLNKYNDQVLKVITNDMKNLFLDFPLQFYNVKSLYNLKLKDISSLTNSKTDISTSSLINVYSDIFKFRKIFNLFKIEDVKHLKRIPNFLFFGTLLGNHLLPIMNKTNANSYLIIEPNLEIFRLSLFITDYKLLSKNRNVFFSTESETLSIIKKFESYINLNHLNNYIFKYYSTSFHSPSLMNNFTFALQNKSPFLHNHYNNLHYLKYGIKNIKKYPKICNNITSFKILSKPILILSPGPSLRKNFKWIKENKDKFIILSFTATIKALCEIGIIPDIVINVDTSDLILNQLEKNCKHIFQSTITILAVDTHKKVFKKFKKNNIFVYESNFNLSQNGIEEAPVSTVGESTLHILLSLGFKDIYLLGTDLCIDSNTGSAYDKTHSDANKHQNITSNKNNIKKISNNIKLDTSKVLLKGNLQEKDVVSNQFFLNIIKNYTLIIEHHKKNKEFNVYNLSDGAFINGTIPLDTSIIKQKNNIKNKKKNIKRLLLDISSHGFNKNDIRNFKNEIKFLKLLEKEVLILKEYNIKEFSQFYTFMQCFISTIITHKSYSTLTHTLLLGYIKTINNYINYYYNNISQLDSIIILNNTINEWCTQILHLLGKYIKLLTM